MPNLLKNKWVTEQEDDRRETHNAGNTEEGAGFIIAQPQPETTENQTMAENKSPNPVSSPTSGRTTEPEDGVPDAPSNQIKPDQIEPEKSTEAVTAQAVNSEPILGVETTSNHKKADENPLTSESDKASQMPLNPETPFKQEVTPNEEHRTNNALHQIKSEVPVDFSSNIVITH